MSNPPVVIRCTATPFTAPVRPSAGWSCPGSPVMPMGGGARRGAEEPREAPTTPTHERRGPRSSSRCRRFVVLAAGAGAGVGHLLWTSPSASRRRRSAGAAQQAQDRQLPPNLVPGGSPIGSGGATSPFSGGSPSSDSAARQPVPPTAASSKAAGAPADVSAIASKVDPALVDVNSTFSYQSAAGAGTGIVVTSTGEVLTNNHVIDQTTKISVTDLGNDKTYAANVVGYDPSLDLAVLQLEGASGLTTASFADSSRHRRRAGRRDRQCRWRRRRTDERWRIDHRTRPVHLGERRSRRNERAILEAARDERRHPSRTPAAPSSTAPDRSSAWTPPGPLATPSSRKAPIEHAGLRGSRATRRSRLPDRSRPVGDPATLHVGPTAMLGVLIEPPSVEATGGTAGAGRSCTAPSPAVLRHSLASLAVTPSPRSEVNQSTPQTA